MWTDEEERQLMESWRRAEAKRKEEDNKLFRMSARDEGGFRVLEMPPENLTPSYPWTGNGPETSMAMLRRANAGTCDASGPKQPLTEAEMGMSQREFDALSTRHQLAIANAAFFARAEKK